MPGTIINYDEITNIPIIRLESLVLTEYEILKIFKAKDLPQESNWQEHNWYYTNRNRVVYCTKNHQFILKVWQKNYSSTDNFLAALHAHFYQDIALISALIFDEDNECRGYISPYMIDRTNNRAVWNSFGYVLEKGPIQVKIFSNYYMQPHTYKTLFDTLLKRTQASGYVSLDFCPDNVAFNIADKKPYLIDLEDVHHITDLDDPLLYTIFSPYLPKDYLNIIYQMNK